MNDRGARVQVSEEAPIVPASIQRLTRCVTALRHLPELSRCSRFCGGSGTAAKSRRQKSAQLLQAEMAGQVRYHPLWVEAPLEIESPPFSNYFPG